MKLSFTKMQGCANDYIYLDCRASGVPADIAALAQRLSARHFSVGADGIICICAPVTPGADGRMRIFNADGSEGRMCGNGVRCVAEYLFRHGYASGTAADVETLSGVKHIVRREPGLLTVDMGAPELAPEKIPVTGFAKPVVNELVEVNGGAVRMTCVSMGNPHCVVYVSDTAGLNLPVLGGAMEHSKWFPEGVNTEFIQILDETHLKMRVWERGSGETMACGTGACAAVVASVLNGHCKKDTDVDVLLLGGTLTIRYTGDTVLMTGNAVEVFTGTVEV